MRIALTIFVFISTWLSGLIWAASSVRIKAGQHIEANTLLFMSGFLMLFSVLLILIREVVL